MNRNLVSGPIMSFGIGKATENSKTVKEYQGIFFFIGGISCAFVPIIFFMLPNSPTTAKFLRKGNDRVIAIDRLKENQTGTKVSHKCTTHCQLQAHHNILNSNVVISHLNGNGIRYGKPTKIPKLTCGQRCISARLYPQVDLELLVV